MPDLMKNGGPEKGGGGGGEDGYGEGEEPSLGANTSGHLEAGRLDAMILLKAGCLLSHPGLPVRPMS